MNTIHYMRINSEYFNLLRNGTKKIEFRLNDEKRKKVKIGDKICFISRKDPRLVSTLTVTQILRSNSFKNLIKDLDVIMLGGLNKSEQLIELHQIYDTKKQEKLGVLAFFLSGETYGKKD